MCPRCQPFSQCHAAILACHSVPTTGNILAPQSSVGGVVSISGSGGASVAGSLPVSFRTVASNVLFFSVYFLLTIFLWCFLRTKVSVFALRLSSSSSTLYQSKDVHCWTKASPKLHQPHLNPSPHVQLLMIVETFGILNLISYVEIIENYSNFRKFPQLVQL